MLWNLTVVGRGYAVLGAVTKQAGGAFSELTVAQAALASQEFDGSQQHLSNAAQLLGDARLEFREALASNAQVAQYIDVTGTIRSGDQLLAAGQSIVEAAADFTAGLEIMMAGQMVPLEGKSSAPTMPLVTALEKALLSFDEAHAALVDAEQSLDRVTGVMLPRDIKDQIMKLQKAVPAMRIMLGSFLDQSQVLLSMLGSTQDRQYLILFQNNHEIRPTGGFIGSLALVNVKRGVVEDIDVQTVYDGDGQLKDIIAPPDPLLPITNRWYLRDANWFVEYPLSAKKIINFFEKEGGPTVDGVIALTPEVIKGLLALTGPITMPEYGVVVDDNSFVSLTQDLVTYSYNREINKPKQFLADLTPKLLNRIFADRSNVLEVLALLSDMARQKQILAFFTNADEQAQITRQGWDGSLPKAAPNFLSVVNANIGGHKSDQFIVQEIDLRLNVLRDGATEALVTLRRTHQGPAEKLDYAYPPDDNPAFKENVIYQRVFVPRGAELLEAKGFTPATQVPRHAKPLDGISPEPDGDVAEWQRLQRPGLGGTAVGEEAGYTYFANWIVTKPGATSIGLYRYRLPPQRLPAGLNLAETVAVLVAKQPGDMRSLVRIEVRLPNNMRVVHTVPDEGITQTDSNSLVYQGPLRRDVLLGAVIEQQ